MSSPKLSCMAVNLFLDGLQTPWRTNIGEHAIGQSWPTSWNDAPLQSLLFHYIQLKQSSIGRNLESCLTPLPMSEGQKASRELSVIQPRAEGCKPRANPQPTALPEPPPPPVLMNRQLILCDWIWLYPICTVRGEEIPSSGSGKKMPEHPECPACNVMLFNHIWYN